MIDGKVYAVYTITSPSGKVYVGITSQPPRKRFNAHRRVPNLKLGQAIAKYGWDTLDKAVICEGLSRDEACEVEKALIIQHNSYRNGYNMSPGGDKISDVAREMNSARMKADNPMKPGMRNVGTFAKGHQPKITPERNAKISAAKMGERNPNYGATHLGARLNNHVCCILCKKTTNLGNFKRWHTHAPH